MPSLPMELKPSSNRSHDRSRMNDIAVWQAIKNSVELSTFAAPAQRVLAITISSEPLQSNALSRLSRVA